jgi:hypothetical protein
MVIFTKENGLMTKPMGMVYIHTTMEQDMKGFGKMTFNMGMEKNNVIQNNHMMILGIDGSKYVGDFSCGKKHGKGFYTFPDKTTYEGDWFDNKITGKVE